MNVGRRLAALAAVFLFLRGAASFAGAQTTFPQNVDRSAAKAKAQGVDRSSVQRDYDARRRGAQREAAQRPVPRGVQSRRGRALTTPRHETHE